MAYEYYPITGIPLVPGGGLPTRQEITVWYQNDANKIQVSLFMQAMENFMARPVEDRLSYFQIAGIHSFPLVGWDGEKAAPPRDPNKYPPGYCAHNLVTFPVWHRPYMLLFEQALYEEMLQLIESWKNIFSDGEEQEWRSAASQWRLPYWDWARKQPSLDNYAYPDICCVDTVRVVMPGEHAGGSREMTNPLVKYTNSKKDSSGKPVRMGDPSMKANKINDDDPPFGSPPLPWSRCMGTSRYGILEDDPESKWCNGINNWANGNTSMGNPPWYKGKGGMFGDAVNRMLSPDYFKSWEAFSTTAHTNDPENAKAFLSIEYIHNIIHNATGGQFMNLKAARGDPSKPRNPSQPLGLGHMSDVPVAAFDPIFWLHHCNIDRLCAIWQTLNPEKWFDKPSPGDPKPTDPLTPFHYDTAGNTWDSERAKEWTKSNYQYDDLDETPFLKPDGTLDKEKYLNNLRARINELYPGADQRANTAGFMVGNEDFNDYVINVVYDRYALGGRAYTIAFFLGDAPEDYSNYTNDERYLGQIYTFSAPVEVDGAVACANCDSQRRNNKLSLAQIPITVPLIYQASHVQDLERSGEDPASFFGIPDVSFGGLRRDVMSGLLKAAVTPVFIELGGRVRPLSDFPNTQYGILVGTGKYTEPQDELPTYAGYELIKAFKGTPENRWAGYGDGEDEDYAGLIQSDPTE